MRHVCGRGTGSRKRFEGEASCVFVLTRIECPEIHGSTGSRRLNSCMVGYRGANGGSLRTCGQHLFHDLGSCISDWDGQKWWGGGVDKIATRVDKLGPEANGERRNVDVSPENGSNEDCGQRKGQ